MSNLTTHMSHQRNVPPGAMDVWNQGQGVGTALAVPNPAQQPQPQSPVALVQRLLRGRVALAVVLAGVGAIIGGAAGYMSQAQRTKPTALFASPRW
ncbi:MAG: hypothetical protein QM754_05745 [Tepidisphaeraceae bacterium]